MRIFDRLHLLLVACVLGVCVGGGRAQKTPAAVTSAENTADAATPNAVKRNELLKPGLEQLRKGYPTAALAALRPALEAYPNDVFVLSYSAEAAMEAHQDDDALGFFKRGLQQKPRDPWHMRIAMLLLDARLGHWPDFYHEQAALKKAKQDGEPELASTAGFLVDDVAMGGLPVKVAYFPLLAGEYKTLYRFVLPAPPAVEESAVASDGDKCKDPNFHPYIDVESDDVDQAAFQSRHPDLAAQGGRSYSLDSYPAACSQALIKFYPDGEPTYQAVRADVIKFLQAKPGPRQGTAAKP